MNDKFIYRLDPRKYPWFCPCCLKPVGIIGNFFAKIFGTQIHNCNFRNVISG